MNQLDLFSTTTPARYDDMPEPAPVARARASDPESSKAAAAEMNETRLVATQTQQVIDAVWKFPGRTSKELAELDGVLDRHTFGRRMSNAEATGEIHRRKVYGKRDLCWFPGRAT